MTWQPETLLPFAVDREAAGRALREWTKGRWFAPNDLREVAESGAGSVYVPHWLISAHARTSYRGERGDHYQDTVTKTETDADGRTTTRSEQVRKTRWSSRSGVVTRTFEHLLVTGTDEDGPRLAKLRPWPLAELVAARWPDAAEHHLMPCRVDPLEAVARARKSVEPTVRRDCRRDIGGDDQRVHRVETVFEHVRQSLVLLPMWRVEYRHRGRTFSVLVNGGTGAVVGDRPYSVPKIVAAVLAVLAVAGLVAAYVAFGPR